MLTSEVKRKMVTDLITFSVLPDKETEVQKLLHDMLMKDTQNGKLYKYRSVSDYSLGCLRTGTMYCAVPDSFNDPFDCRIGVTFQSLFSAKYEKEFDLLEDVLTRFLLVCYGKKNIDEFDNDTQRIIRKLLKNERIMDFVTEKQGTVTTLEEENALLLQNGYVITELLQTVLSDESFKESLGICDSMLPLLYEKITSDGLVSLSDKNVTIENFAKSNGINDDADEIELTFQISEKMFPENHESAENVMRMLNDVESQITKALNERFRIGCLATDYKNRLMWSHYSDCHKGFCIEYDFSSGDEQSLNMIPFPVIYSEKRQLIPWKAALDKTPENLEMASLQMVLGLLTKDKAWEYENEWRILIENSEDPFVKMPPISCVYLGANMDNEDKAEVIRAAAEQGIPVKQMVIDRGAYTLHAHDVADVRNALII